MTDSRKDKIHKSINQKILKKGFVSPVDVLMDIGVLTKMDYDNWRFGKVPFLEMVCKANLNKLSDIMKELRKYALQTNLKESWTFYHQYGKDKKKKLHFSKSGMEKIENAYATHYVANKS